MIPFNTFSVHTLVGTALMACLAVLLFATYCAPGRSALYLLLGGISLCVAGICWAGFVGCNLVPEGDSAWLTSRGLDGGQLGRLGLLWSRIQWTAGILTMPLLCYFAGLYCRSRGFLARHVWLVYAAAAALIGLIWSGLLFQARSAPVSPTSSWRIPNPWRPQASWWALAVQLSWIAGQAYCLAMVWRERHQCRLAGGNLRTHPGVILLSLISLTLTVVVDFARSQFALLPGPGLIPLGACAMTAFLAVALMLDHFRHCKLRQQAEARIEDVREQEKKRLAADLHDCLAQEVWALQLMLAGARQSAQPQSALEDGVNRCKQILKSIRKTCHGLYPPTLALGLAPALRRLLADFRSPDAQGEISLDERLEGTPLPERVGIGLLRIAQEALSNAVRHGRPTRVKLSLYREDGHVVLSVTDNGTGFDPKAPWLNAGLGMTTMAERARALGGRLEIRSRPGETTLSAYIPLPDAPAEASQS